MRQEQHKFTLEDVKATYKKKDAWWTVLLVDPVASRLIVPTANHTNITPNQLSIFSFILGLTAAYCFFLGNYAALVAGALLYHISFIIDCMDGKIARLKGTGSTFGMLLDISLDHIRVVLCGAALTYSQFRLTGDVTYLYLAFLFLAAYCARHINALQLYKLRRDMRGKLRKARRKLKRTAEAAGIVINEPEVQNADKPEEDEEEAEKKEALDRPSKAEGPEEELLQKKRFDLQQEFKSKFSTYMRIRDFFLNKRIRMHLFSGIEFQMFIFVVAPIVGLLKETIFFGSILLMAFEAAIVYKIWLSTKDFEREFTRIRQATEKIEATLPPEDDEDADRMEAVGAK
ncbi:phosphatidylglycerophosphate synthase [Melghirimyces profundicolus]|uniref:Phosphatidylglycerophosphate synthase n=1 Tax=Melghirimyces profundicolus TaxID=1242148 RepID=A0A2T6B3K7_9BACL|nr:CDP-alcohol phosphatidyltransferase family protein [Melghirimyces profundicolus]PTX50641.1 phosphatidylglycerophosphate synthase [Melghirimyces profundicolus]